MFLLSSLRKRINAKNELCDFSCEIFSMFFVVFCIEIDRFLQSSLFLRIKIAFIQYLQFSFAFTLTKTDKTENKLDTLILFVSCPLLRRC